MPLMFAVFVLFFALMAADAAADTDAALMARPVQAQAVQEDSLAAKEIPPPSDIERKDLRILTKLGSGTLMSLASGAIIMNRLLARWKRTQDDDYESSGHEGISAFWRGMYYGTMLGFPIGVSLADPHDSFAKTLLGGAMGGVIGLVTNSGFLVLVGPPIVSIAVSEKSRKSPQDRRVSFGLIPNPEGGLSAVAKLRF